LADSGVSWRAHYLWGSFRTGTRPLEAASQIGYVYDALNRVQLHKYVYCKANPIDGVDPSGHDDFDGLLNVFNIWAYLFKSRIHLNLATGVGQGGPGITASLTATLADVEATWAPWNWEKKWDSANELRNYTEGARTGAAGGRAAWDIGPLHAVAQGADKIGGCTAGTGSFVGSVAFNGNCYFAHAVNYALWGRAMKLSHEFVASDSVFSIRWQASRFTLHAALKLARDWKHIEYGDYGIGEQEAEAFTKYGYDGTLPPATIALPCKSSGQTADPSAMTWHWAPYH
jgi:hypothetical protein